MKVSDDEILKAEVKQRFAEAAFREEDFTQRHRGIEAWRFDDVPPSWDNVVRASEED